MSCHFLLQGIFPTQELNLGLPHCRQTLYHLSHQGSPLEHFSLLKNNPRDFPCGPEVRSSPRGSDGRSICLQCGRPGFDPWMGKILWRRKWQLTPGPLPGKFHGWRSLVGYGPWGPKELDRTERLHFHFSLSCVGEKMATHSSVLAWRIPWTEEPDGLWSMGSQRVGHD